MYMLEKLLQPKINVWSAAIGEAFLAPYDLNSEASTWTAAGTAGSVHKALADLPADVDVYTYKPDGAAAAGGRDPRYAALRVLSAAHHASGMSNAAAA